MEIRVYGHVSWKNLKEGMILLSSGGDGHFSEEVLFIKAKREQVVEFDSITIHHGQVVVQYDDWSTKYAWEQELSPSRRKMNEEFRRRFVWQLFKFALSQQNCKIFINTRANLLKLPIEEVEAREIENEKNKEENKDRWR